MLETKSNPQLSSDLDSLASNQSAVSRFDPISGNWAIFAPHREQRPDQFQLTRSETKNTNIGCPFCRGSETETPDPVWVGRTIDGVEGTRRDSLATMQCIDDPMLLRDLSPSDWSVRVVPNKFPAINVVPSNNKFAASRQSKLFPQQEIHGGHEVIIESPDHHQSLVEIDAADVALVFAAYRDRIRYWSQVDGIQYISLFKNAGGDAGASLAHSHSQLIATSIMPNDVQADVTRMKKHRAKTGCCLQCDLVRAELKEKSRIITKSDSLVAYCPFASHMPMMVRITTIDHHDRFDSLSDETIESVSRLLRRVASWIERLRPGACLQLFVTYQPPRRNEE